MPTLRRRAWSGAKERLLFRPLPHCTAWYRRRRDEVREARDREIRALLEAALRKLEEGSS